MRQLLMLGFYCEVYRREPRCRVYVNDLLVDEFNISHTPRIDKCTTEIVLDPKYFNYDCFVFESHPTFLKFIELDDADGKSLDLKVEIHNNDNNYNNGFMTEYTRVMLSQCFLAPVKVWEQFEQIRNRWRFSMPNWHRCFGNTISVDQYYSGRRSYVVDNLAGYTNLVFPHINQPDINQHKMSRESVISHGGPLRHWVGSSGHFHLTLVKKLGLWRHSTDQRRGWWKIGWANIAKHLYDKYRSNEDTRSTN
jgi:hypothetical protein